MCLAGRNFCQNGLAEQCEKERSDSSEGGKDALCTVQDFGITSRESASIQP